MSVFCFIGWCMLPHTGHGEPSTSRERHKMISLGRCFSRFSRSVFACVNFFSCASRVLFNDISVFSFDNFWLRAISVSWIKFKIKLMWGIISLKCSCSVNHFLISFIWVSVVDISLCRVSYICCSASNSFVILSISNFRVSVCFFPFSIRISSSRALLNWGSIRI